jgi:hypothetical protein
MLPWSVSIAICARPIDINFLPSACHTAALVFLKTEGFVPPLPETLKLALEGLVLQTSRGSRDAEKTPQQA